MKHKSPQPAIDFAEVTLKTDIAADRRILKQLAEVPISIRREPRTALVMMTATDGTGTDFHVGEVLVTEAEVEYAGKIGYALVVGNRPEKALARACLSVLTAGNKNHIPARLRGQLLRENRTICKRECIEAARIASTMVDFESMTQW